MIQKIEPAAAIRLLDAKKAQAVDVREPDEYAVGHIPGAKLLPLGEVMSRAAEVLPDKDAPWLVYCRTGRRSADAVQKLDALGYTNIVTLQNSGNAVLDTNSDQAALIHEVTGLMRERFGLEIPVYAIEQESLRELLAQSPA